VSILAETAYVTTCQYVPSDHELNVEERGGVSMQRQSNRRSAALFVNLILFTIYP
jgi:hypothetical protein